MNVRFSFIILLFVALFVVTGLFLFTGAVLNGSHVVQINNGVPPSFPDAPPKILPATIPQSATSTLAVPVKKNLDIEPQQPLSNPPEIIKAIYATSWSAGSTAKMNYLVNLIKETELNAIVIDIKDFSGYITYATDLELPKKYDAVEIRTPKINTLLKRLHDEGIYAIARVSVFQDQRLAAARPELALTSSSTKSVWMDRKGLTWIDAASKEAWSYNVHIAREAFERGFDEVNFDYIRFAADGDLSDIVYPFWDGKTSRANVIKEFWQYLRDELPGRKISADLFGLTTVNKDDLGIGQRIENSFMAFDVIAPMVYPSHYYPGSFGFEKPAVNPYEVVKYSMDEAFRRLAAYNSKITAQNNATSSALTGPLPLSAAKFRPWLQDFDLGADYDASMVRKQIEAVYDAASSTPELLSGWMLWNPSNVYTRDALMNE